MEPGGSMPHSMPSENDKQSSIKGRSEENFR